jgi:hypothetical protein
LLAENQDKQISVLAVRLYHAVSESVGWKSPSFPDFAVSSCHAGYAVRQGWDFWSLWQKRGLSPCQVHEALEFPARLKGTVPFFATGS